MKKSRFTETQIISILKQQDARSLNLFGTPAFFVNGQLVYGMQENVIRELIEESLANQ